MLRADLDPRNRKIFAVPAIQGRAELVCAR
jgi:hypothetical protein